MNKMFLARQVNWCQGNVFSLNLEGLKCVISLCCALENTSNLLRWPYNRAVLEFGYLLHFFVLASRTNAFLVHNYDENSAINVMCDMSA